MLLLDHMVLLGFRSHTKVKRSKFYFGAESRYNLINLYRVLEKKNYLEFLEGEVFLKNSSC